MEYSNTYVKIDMDAILENFDAIQKRAGAKVLAVVKANAYGHGAVPVAQALEDRCDFFGVAEVSEALELRQAGIRKPILMLGYASPDTFPVVVEQDVRPTIFTYEDAQALSREAVKQGKTAPFHIAVDTGMSRIGFQATEESADICLRITQLPGIKAEGLFSHFATADEADLTKTYAQADLFEKFDQMLRVRGVQIPVRHLDNSAGILNFGSHYEMVRAGIALYGVYPSDQVAPAKVPLRPAMSWHTQVSCVKTLEPGREVSYGGTYVTAAHTVVATVPVGYADGYRRSLSGKFYVLIRGQKAPVLGRVCMDQFMVDVTHIPGVAAGEPVVLMGTDGGAAITVEALSGAAGSFSYEQLCAISHRVPRVYYCGGKKVRSVNYLLEK